MSTQDKLKNIICEYVDASPEQIDINMSLKFDVGLDSFGLVSLVSEIENQFDIHIPDATCSQFNTLSDMVSYIDGEIR